MLPPLPLPPRLLSHVPPSLHPPAPLLLARTISGSGSGALTGVFPQMKGEASVVTRRVSYLMDQSRGKILPECKSWEMTSIDSTLSPCSLGVPDPGTWGQGKGGVAKLGLHLVPHTLNEC
jgi:hypothetical protein